MFGCCRRGINLLFVAVNQISTDRFKLIASVSWSQKKTVLQAVISFYFPSDILINDMRTQTVGVLFYVKISSAFGTLQNILNSSRVCNVSVKRNKWLRVWSILVCLRECASFKLWYLNLCKALMHKRTWNSYKINEADQRTNKTASPEKCSA